MAFFFTSQASNEAYLIFIKCWTCNWQNKVQSTSSALGKRYLRGEICSCLSWPWEAQEDPCYCTACLSSWSITITSVILTPETNFLAVVLGLKIRKNSFFWPQWSEESWSWTLSSEEFWCHFQHFLDELEQSSVQGPWCLLIIIPFVQRL